MKNKFLKRILSVLLCISVFCCSYSLTVFGASVTATVFKAIATWVVEIAADSLMGLIQKNTSPEVVLANKSKFIAVLRDYALKNNLDYDSAYQWLADCAADWDEDLFNRYGDNAADMYNVMHEPVWQLCYNYIYEMDLASLASLITNPDKQAPEISSDGSVKIPVKDFKDYVDNTANMFFPKNAAGKMTFRTDNVYKNCYIVNTTTLNYEYWNFYNKNTFSALGENVNEMYMIFYYNYGNDSYYGLYQYHFKMLTEDHWYEDRDEVEYTGYTLECECWDMVEGFQDDPLTFTAFSGVTQPYFFVDLQAHNSLKFISSSNSTYPFPFKNNLYTTYSVSLATTASGNSHKLFLPDYSRSMYFYTPSRFYLPVFDDVQTYEKHNAAHGCNGFCDIGYLASASPIKLDYNIDTSKIPDNYYITITGDTVYDYRITNPETGQSDTINNYVTNNYTYVTNNNPGSGGSSGGNITVGGKVDVGGSVGVDINVNVPDININVNQGNVGGGNNLGGTAGNYSFPDTDPFNSYYDEALDESSGFRQFLSSFFGFLPVEIIGLLGIGLTLAILSRLFGR